MTAGGSDSKESPAMWETQFDPWIEKMHREWLPTPEPSLENSTMQEI